MSFYCPTCQTKITAREHTCVSEKVCVTCSQKKTIHFFKTHASSFDGHRNSCLECEERQRAQAIDYRQQQNKDKEARNATFRLFGYRWKKVSGKDMWDSPFFHPEMNDPDDEMWVLTSPTGTHVDEHNVTSWLTSHGVDLHPESYKASLKAYLQALGYSVQDGQITNQQGGHVSLSQVFQEAEYRRAAFVAEEQTKHSEQVALLFKQSALSLKECLDTYGSATNDQMAWGYASATASRTPDGKIKLLTYHMEGEWREEVVDNEEEALSYLYTDGDGYWYPDTQWTKA